MPAGGAHASGRGPFRRPSGSKRRDAVHLPAPLAAVALDRLGFGTGATVLHQTHAGANPGGFTRILPGSPGTRTGRGAQRRFASPWQVELAGSMRSAGRRTRTWSMASRRPKAAGGCRPPWRASRPGFGPLPAALTRDGLAAALELGPGQRPQSRYSVDRAKSQRWHGVLSLAAPGAPLGSCCVERFPAIEKAFGSRLQAPQTVTVLPSCISSRQ